MSRAALDHAAVVLTKASERGSGSGECLTARGAGAASNGPTNPCGTFAKRSEDELSLRGGVVEDGELAFVDGNGLKIALELGQVLHGHDGGFEFVASRVL